jgi:alkylation response protein AidB-like acyl-CoA dehydrogenase
MTWHLTDEQLMLQQTIREMAQARILPRAKEVDETCEFPMDWVQTYRDLGLFGIPFKPEYGGLSGSALTLAIAVEELSKVDATAGLAAIPLTSRPPRRRSSAGSPPWPAASASVRTRSPKRVVARTRRR